SISAGVLSGLLPALQASSPDLNESLKAGARNATVRGRARRFRDWLVVAETALALVLLVAAGLTVRSLWRLYQVDLRFDPKNVLTLHCTIPPYKFNPGGAQKREFVEARQRAFIERVVEGVRSLPGVVSVAAAASVPLRGVDYFAGFDIVGKPSVQYGARYR